MTRPLTLFTGQWADLPFEEMCKLASGWGYDGLEIACWGDHFDVERAANDDSYIADRKAVLDTYGLQVFAISNHLKGQAVCDDPIDGRHRDILPDEIWGDGDPEGVRQRAAEEMKDTARMAAKLGVKTVTGFTGSSVWHATYAFPPTPNASPPCAVPSRSPARSRWTCAAAAPYSSPGCSGRRATRPSAVFSVRTPRAPRLRTVRPLPHRVPRRG